eukprot:TRINITY_DN2891_c0_g1_i5.p1 TRINITY_DN2891_c0_g1~~TRINITY_DN2891_c0_g1_i5.p1  ORF type:complete len:210 (+),score=65.16 TRINITY_DN2891_c0_g1_i5:49-678(+)
MALKKIVFKKNDGTNVSSFCDQEMLPQYENQLKQEHANHQKALDLIADMKAKMARLELEDKDSQKTWQQKMDEQKIKLDILKSQLAEKTKEYEAMVEDYDTRIEEVRVQLDMQIQAKEKLEAEIVERTDVLDVQTEKQNMEIRNLEDQLEVLRSETAEIKQQAAEKQQILNDLKQGRTTVQAVNGNMKGKAPPKGSTQAGKGPRVGGKS